MITIQIDEKQYKKIIQDTYDGLAFIFGTDCEPYDSGFEKLVDLIDDAIKKAKK